MKKIYLILSSVLLLLTGCGYQSPVSAVCSIPSCIKRVEGGIDFESGYSHVQTSDYLESGTYYVLNKSIEIVDEEIEACLPEGSIFKSGFTVSDDCYIKVKYTLRNTSLSPLTKTFYIYTIHDNIGHATHVKKLDVPTLLPNEECIVETTVYLNEDDIEEIKGLGYLKLIQVGADEYIIEY